METLQLMTSRREELLDITPLVREVIRRNGLESTVVTVFSPHTTAGLTINEGADPNVCRDILAHLKVMVPERAMFHHAEGNSDAHLKTALVGSSVQVIVHEKILCLGTWQKIFLAEFDGPRPRQCWVQWIRQERP
ncbi:MAG: YjbQ family protein [Deltaproteobacteria bacterium]|nr:YjbQ family protein [Deltaproteobacteria bacterium]